jgi:outer membrane protein assembly factor BamE (lipoprotein component of BamABCDE complex)
MKRLLALLCSLLTALGLAGCDRAALQELRPGVSTAREVKERMGPPNYEWHNEDGSLTWEFSRQPEGVECFMATIGPDQILRSIEQVLTEANFERIQPGMIHQEVLRRLGKPAKKEYFELKQEHVWSWLIDHQMPGQKVYFTVSFNADGRVTRSGPVTEQYN